MDPTVFWSVLSIVLIDLVLSGDNAVVIGMAAHRLPPKQRRQAILIGGGAAIGLRILFTALAAFLLGIPLLQFVGGLLLVWIAFKLVADEESAGPNVAAAHSFAAAIWTIMVADAVMSLDNILAIGGASHGELWLLLFGLGLSMPIIMFGSGVIATLMNRLPWLVYAGSLVLGWTAAEMMLRDEMLGHAIGARFPHGFEWLFPLLVAVVVTVAGAWWGGRNVPSKQPLSEHHVSE